MALVAYGALKDRIPPRAAAAATLALAAAWGVGSYAAGGMPDVLITLGLLGAALEIERGIELEDNGALARAAVYLNLAALSKNEGAVITVAGATVVGAAFLARVCKHCRQIDGNIGDDVDGGSCRRCTVRCAH